MRYFLIIVALTILSACQNEQVEIADETDQIEKFNLHLQSHMNLNNQLFVEVNYAEIDIAIASSQASGEYNTVDSLRIMLDKYIQLKENVKVVKYEINKYHKIVTGEYAPHILDYYDSTNIPNKEDIEQLYLNSNFSSNNTEESKNVLEAFNHFLNWGEHITDSIQKNARISYMLGQQEILFNTFSELLEELENSKGQDNLKTMELIFATENSMYNIENLILHYYFKIINRIEKETDVNTMYRI